MTPTETNARNADDEPRLINPRSSWIRVVSASAKIGVPWRSSILDHRLAKGIALSRANAHVVLEAATVMDMEQNKVMMSTSKVRAMAPPGDPITLPKMYGSACPTGAPRISANSGSVAHKGIICSHDVD